MILILFFICCGYPSSWGRQQVASTFNTSHSDCDLKVETAYPSCRLNSTFTVSEKPPFPHLGIAPCRCPSHMPMDCCHKIPVTRLQCYCHLGCNRLLEIAVVTQYPVTEPLEFFDFHPPRPRWLTSSRKTSALCCRVTTNLFDP